MSERSEHKERGDCHLCTHGEGRVQLTGKETVLGARGRVQGGRVQGGNAAAGQDAGVQDVGV